MNVCLSPNRASASGVHSVVQDGSEGVDGLIVCTLNQRGSVLGQSVLQQHALSIKLRVSEAFYRSRCSSHRLGIPLLHAHDRYARTCASVNNISSFEAPA